MVKAANEIVEVVSAAEAIEQQCDSTMLIDIRDIRELQREGTVNQSRHVPRGMAEFWFDEKSPYHKEFLADQSCKYVLFCASGWRSALTAKTLKEMGFDNIAHVDGGFGALKEAGAEIVEPDRE